MFFSFRSAKSQEFLERFVFYVNLKENARTFLCVRAWSFDGLLFGLYLYIAAHAPSQLRWL